MKKKTSVSVPTEIQQTRPYDSMENAKVDADQFVRFPDVFARKAPVPAQWGIKAKVVKASVLKGNPPEVKHQLVLTIEVSGPAEKVIAWDQECSKAFTLLKGGDHVSKQMGVRYLAIKTGRSASGKENTANTPKGARNG